jgi:7-carboxy-7-deazaguanine synthase
MKSLTVAEQFYSIQGEGPTMGVPAFFLRVTGCNLMCGGKGTEDDKRLHDGATWRCDSIEVWRKGKVKTFEQIWYDWASDSQMPLIDLLSKREAHIVLTGGEPMLQQVGLGDFVEWIKEHGSISPYIEVETNGTRKPNFLFNELIDQYNISPKLSNSGMKEPSRINDEALKFFARTSGSNFKFVVSSEKDIEEVFYDFVKPYSIDAKKVYLMPAADNRNQLQEVSEFVAGVCKREGFRFSSRLQLSIWDKKTGV